MKIGQACGHSGEKATIHVLIDGVSTELSACVSCIDHIKGFQSVILEVAR